MIEPRAWRSYMARRRWRMIWMWSVTLTTLLGSWFGERLIFPTLLGTAVMVWALTMARSPSDPGWRCMWSPWLRPETNGSCRSDGLCNCAQSIEVERRISMQESTRVTKEALKAYAQR